MLSTECCGPSCSLRAAASVRREPLLGLSQGARQAGDIRQPRRAVRPRVDARVEASLVWDGDPDQLVPRQNSAS